MTVLVHDRSTSNGSTPPALTPASSSWTIPADLDAELLPTEPLRIGLFGAPPDTGDLSQAALKEAILTTIYRIAPRARFTVFDHSRSPRVDHLYDDDAQHHLFERIGAVNNRRWLSPNCLVNIRACGLLGGLGNPVITAIRDADMILDAGGSMGLTDSRGIDAFRAAVLPKRIALQQDRLLILLPQTYGPFTHIGSKQIAARIVRASAMAWASDPVGFARLRDLLGPAFDPRRHRLGVDPAVTLTRAQPDPEKLTVLKRWLATPWNRRIIINIHSEMWPTPRTLPFRRGVDLRKLLTFFLTRLVEQYGSRALLVPQVRGDGSDHLPCDYRTAQHFHAALPDHLRCHVDLSPADLTAAETKWTLGEANWVLAMQPNTAIASLSSNVPTVALADDDRMAERLNPFGQSDAVLNTRESRTDTALAQLNDAFDHRDDARFHLVERLTDVFQRADAQMESIIHFCHDWRRTHSGQNAA